MSAQVLVLLLVPIGSAIGTYVAVRVQLALIRQTADRALEEADRANRRIDLGLVRGAGIPQA